MSVEVEENDTVNAVLGSLGSLSQTSLRTRLSVLKHVVTYLENNEWAETKPGPLKKLYRTIAVSFLDDQFDEQSWTNALVEVLAKSVELALPFSVPEVVEGIIIELQAVQFKFNLPLGSARLIEFAAIVLELFVPKVVVETEGSTTAALPAWASKLIAVIGEQSEKILEAELELAFAHTGIAPVPALKRAQAKAKHYVGDLLRKQPQLLNDCLSTWFPVATPTKARGCMGGALLAYTKQRQPAEYERVRRVICEVYQKRLLTLTKQQSLALSSVSWVPFISSLTPLEWTNTAETEEGFESLLIKAMKKAPESGSYVACTLVTHVDSTVDMSNFVTQIGAVSAIKMLKSSDAGVRTAGLRLVCAMSSKTTDAAAFQLLVTQLCEGFLGKGAVGAGGLQSSQGIQKRCVLDAIAQCGEHVYKSLGSTAAASVAVGFLPSLQTILEKEVDASVRLQAAAVLGTWLKHAVRSGVTLSAEDATKLKAHLTTAKTQIEKALNNPQCACYLLAVVMAVRDTNSTQTDADLSLLEPYIATGCLNIVKEVSKKPTGAGTAAPPSVEGVLALHLLLHLIRTSSAVLSAFEAAKLWSTVSTASSFLFAGSLQTSLTSLSTSGNSTSGSGAVNAFVPITAASVAEGVVDTIGSFLLSAEAVLAIASSVHIVATEHTAQIAALFSGEPNQAVKSLTQYMVLPADQQLRVEVSAHVQGAITALVNADASGAASIVLLKALWAQLSALSTQQQRYTQEASTNFKSASEEGSSSPTPAGSAKLGVKAPVIPSPARWIDAILAAIPAPTGGDADSIKTAVRKSALVPHLLLLSAHPFVSSSPKKAAQVWQKVVAKLLALFGLSSVIPESEFEDPSSSLAAAVLEHSLNDTQNIDALILGPLSTLVGDAAGSDIATIRRAAHQALYLLSDPSQILYADKRSIESIVPQLTPSVLSEHVLPALLPMLNLDAVNALSEQELLTYSDPALALRNILAQLQAESDAARAAESQITNADRKKAAPRSARGKFGADSVVLEDEDWAERVRAEKDQKLLQARSEGGAEYEEIKARVSAQRIEVAKKIDAVLYGIEAFAAFTSVDVRTARASVVLLLDRGLLSPLLRAPIVGQKAFQYLVAIVKHVAEEECQSFAR